MKKVFIALAAVAALASCSKSNVEYAPTGEIGFVPVTKGITKSMITDGTFPPSESFNVWAWYNEVGTGTSVTAWDTETDKFYFEEGEFINKGASWGGKTPYYWPKVGSLLFAGYYPTSIANSVDYTFDSSNNQMVFSNIKQSEVAANGYSEDIMYFNMTPVSHNSGPVGVVFKHALSWVTVNLARPTDNTDAAEYPKITVNEVTFTNVKPQGTGTVTGTDGTIVWTANGTAAPKTVTSEDVVLSTTPQMQKQPLFIPQTLTAEMKLEVEYTIASSANESFTETYSIALAGMNGTQGEETVTVNAWDPAKHYTYNITIGIEEILIAPTVTPWEEVTVAVLVQ